jgi:threonine synthase
MFGDRNFADRFDLSAVNSINWARLMAQIVYYFYAAVRLGAPERPVAFSVPTGNFGDVFAGYVAAKMGLPVARLIVATNVNDIVARALTDGDYSAGEVVPTATPSMDIQVSSNFERLLFDLDGAAVPEQMAAFARDRAMRLTDSQIAGAHALFQGTRVDANDMALAMRWACEGASQILDPHTAVGLAAARAADLPAEVPVVTLATAHPGKFRDAVERATGVRPSLPGRVGSLFEREERYDTLPAELGAVTAYISSRATRGGSG